MNDQTAEYEPRLRTLETMIAKELGEQQQFRHDSRNWRMVQAEDMTKLAGSLSELKEKAHSSELARLQEKIDSVKQLRDLEKDLLPRIEKIERIISGDRVKWGVLMWLAGVGGGLAVMLVEKLMGGK